MHSRGGSLKLSLYGAEGSYSTGRALANVTKLLRAHDIEASVLEFVDVLRQPDRTFDDGVLVTPTLVVTAGGKRSVIVGTLEDPGLLLEILTSGTALE